MKLQSSSPTVCKCGGFYFTRAHAIKRGARPPPVSPASGTGLFLGLKWMPRSLRTTELRSPSLCMLRGGTCLQQASSRVTGECNEPGHGGTVVVGAFVLLILGNKHFSNIFFLHLVEREKHAPCSGLLFYSPDTCQRYTWGGSEGRSSIPHGWRDPATRAISTAFSGVRSRGGS